MIRFAQKKDAAEIAPLIMVILKDMELPFLLKYGEEKTLVILKEAITDPNYRYSYSRGLVEEREGKIAGVAFGYTDEEESVIDEPLKAILKKMGSMLRKNCSLIMKHFPMNGTWIRFLFLKNLEGKELVLRSFQLYLN